MKRFLYSVLPFILFLFILSSCEKEKAPITPINHPPKIEKLEAMPSKVLVNSVVELSCTASDTDNDKLIITWSSKRGAFVNGNSGFYIKWKAPSSPGTDTIFVTVTDGKQEIKGTILIIVGTKPFITELISPVDNSEEVPLTASLKWKLIKNADSYDLQFSTSSDFSTLLLRRKVVTKNTFQLTGLKSNTIYYWRVKSKNYFGSSNWSKTFSFKTVAPPKAPALIAPQNASKDIPLNQIFSWTKLNNASSYSIQIGLDKSFSNIIFSEDGTADTQVQTEVLKYFTTYYWRVNATNSYGTSDWSNTFSFSSIGIAPLPALLVSPDNNSKNILLSVTLDWNTVEHAKTYDLEIAEDSSFSFSVISKHGLSSTQQLVEGLKYFTKYYWHVSSTNDYGTSAWSNVRSFTTKLASPLSAIPKGDEVEFSIWPTFMWNDVNGAEEYSLQVSTDSSFSHIIIDQDQIADTNFQVKRLEYFKKYFWRVKAENSFGKSDWSDSWSFRTTGFFYKGLPYGHQAVYNPFFVVLNGGFDMIQVGNQRDIKKFPYSEGLQNIWKNLSAPFGPIGRYGWGNFISDQVLPLSLNKESAQFWPNYNLHLIGGGMEFAALREWYEYYHYPIPGWLAAFTTMGYHFINEVVENGKRQGDDVDPIADFYLFDLGGVILFTSESVRRFFAEDLNLVDWSQQPSFSLRNGELHNNGQFFAVRWKFPFLKSWYAFYYFGTNGVGGLSYKFDDGSGISLGVGAAASDLILLNEATNKKTIGMVGNAALFYDKNNSLLASLSVTIKTDYMVNLNIYPGVLKIGDISPGLWGAYSQDGNYIFGFTFSWLPFGFGYSTKVSASRY